MVECARVRLILLNCKQDGLPLRPVHGQLRGARREGAGGVLAAGAELHDAAPGGEGGGGPGHGRALPARLRQSGC